jgi:DinB superfamily
MDPYLGKLQREIASATASLSPEQLSWRHPGKWSVAEILEHLYLSYTGTSKGLCRVLDAGRPLATVLTWKQRAQAFVVVELGHMPSGREAPSVTRPRGLAPEKVMSVIAAKLAEMDEIMARCQEKFGARIKLLDHPTLGPCSLTQWRKFHLVHGRHHVKQIYRLRQEISTRSKTAAASTVAGS